MDTSVRPPMRISQSPTYFAPGTPGQPTNMAHTPNNGQMHPQAQAQNQHPPPPQQQQQYPFPQTPLQNSTPPPSATMQHAPALPNHPQLSTPVPLPHAQAQNPRTHPVGYPPQVHIQPAGPTYAAIPNNVRSPMSAHSPSTPQPQYSTAQLAPVTSTMGPPTKPVERVIKEVQYDVDDSLAGTGIDLREEEQYQADYFARNITGGVNSHARTGFPAYTPGSSASFYGAGLANQQPVPADSEQQAEVEAAAAQRAWAESAKNLAATRSIELNSPFLQLGILHARADGIAKKHNISLNLDLKTGTALKFTNESAFRPEVTVKTHVGPDGAMITTSGSFIPAEAALADQFALLALATSHRVRELIGDANQFAIERQRTSHFVPSEWTDAARLHNTSDESAGTAAGTKLNDGSGASPRGSLAKRSFDQTQLPSSEKQVKRIALSTNPAANAMRDIARETKSLEELRLRRRQKLLDAKNGTNGTVRAGSAAPGTPTALAPEPEKAPTKKELKSKNAAAKAAEFSNTLSANRTSLAFLGGKKKKYDWLSGGSAPSTPGRPAGAGVPGTPGTPGGAPGAAPGDNQVFVPEGRTRLGVWREDGEKGKNMQVRDLIFVLQRDGKDLRALQLAYDLQDNAPPPK